MPAKNKCFTVHGNYDLDLYFRYNGDIQREASTR